jgi:hypothetical protein
MKKIGRFLISSSLLIASAMVLCSFTDVQAGCQKIPIAAAQETVKGKASLCSKHGDVTAQFDVSGLTPGNAYSFWFVYIDDAAKCGAEGDATCFGASGAGGQQNAVPDEALGRLSDVVAPSNGRATISGDVPGLQLSKGSEVLLLLKGHGTANTSDNLVRARQLLTPEDLTIGAPNFGIVGGAVADYAGTAAFNN